MPQPTPALRLRVRGGPPALRPAAARVTAAIMGCGVPAERAGAIELAIHELLANALEHGHLGDPSLPIEVEVTGAEPGMVTVRVTDQALGGGWPRRCPTEVPSPAALRGRGLTLARSAGAELGVTSAARGTEVVLRLSTLPAPGLHTH